MAFQLTSLTEAAGPSSHRLAWLASEESTGPVGVAYLRLFTRPEHHHLAEVEVSVHQAERRRGVGTELLAAALQAARADSRRVVLADSVLTDSPGDHFLRSQGFDVALRLVFVRLQLRTANADALAADIDAPHPGYRLTHWQGTVPDDLAQSFADARRAMDDMPSGDIDFGVDIWDVDRVRSVAQAVADRGGLLHTVAVIEETTGAVVGFTELVVPGVDATDGQHYGTGVLPEHRGHGLARWMKAASIRLAIEQYRDLDGLLADTADVNVAMRSINEALGYVPTHDMLRYQLKL